MSEGRLPEKRVSLGRRQGDGGWGGAKKATG